MQFSFFHHPKESEPHQRDEFSTGVNECDSNAGGEFLDDAIRLEDELPTLNQSGDTGTASS